MLQSNGNIGIGTGVPSTKLDINGIIKISGGAPAIGKVLTSDANGVGSWETPAAGGIKNCTWKNNGKAFNTTYTNDTGRPKYVSCSGDGSLAIMTLQINGEDIDNQDTQDGGNRKISVGGIVPPGSTFNCRSYGNAQSNISFLEMKL